ncbi:LysM domain protein [Geobacillus sp. BCO2]|nr:LysM domain protein [Geobacillus sp. BCO2]
MQSGETLAQIASFYGVTVQQLIEVNDITDPNWIAPGQRLIIPPAKPLIEVNALRWIKGRKERSKCAKSAAI